MAVGLPFSAESDILCYHFCSDNDLDKVVVPWVRVPLTLVEGPLAEAYQFVYETILSRCSHLLLFNWS